MTRGSRPAIEVARRLVAMGAEVRAADPHVREPIDAGVKPVDLTPEEVIEADVVVLLSDHDAFDLEMVQENARLIFDTRARMSGAQVERL